MARYHINKHGLPAICRAKPGNCPIGGDNMHFDSSEAAAEHASKEAEKKHGMLPGMNDYNNEEESKKIATRRGIPSTVSGKDLDNLVGKDVRLYGKGERNDGPIYSVDQTDGKRLVRIGTAEGIKTIDLDNVGIISASDENYASPKYKKAMRDIKRPLHEFRYDKKNIKDFKDKYVEVEYDGKTFEGKVIDTKFIEEHDSGLIIESEDGEVKHIKSYRMTDLEVVGDNENDFKNHVQVKNFSNEVTQDARSLSEPDVPEGSNYNPDEEVDKYLSDVIKQEKGEYVDLSKHRVDWEDEVADNRDSYFSEGAGYDGEFEESWDSSSDDEFERDLDRAAEVNDYYENKKDFINDIVKKAKSTDWTQYGKTQEQGVVDALEYIRDRDLIRGE